MQLSINPATGVELVRFDDHTPEFVEEALNRAVTAQKAWRKVSIEDRTALLRRIAQVLRAGIPKYANLIALEVGKPIVEAEAGEPWHPFVQEMLARGLSGVENLSLIPGTVGAAPMQNIGAYGVELKDVFHSLVALDRENGELREFSLADCAFGYRDSVFKHQTGRWLILRVRFKLSFAARLHLDYGPVRQRLQEQGINEPTPMHVSRAICEIRSEKLPDPAVLGNAGSFFKNPVVPAELAERIKQTHPGLVAYPQPDGQVKLAAGWLIEQAGWKGFREGDAGVHALQSLVLVNYGSATGRELLTLAQRIQADILERFGVTLEMEPNLY